MSLRVWFWFLCGFVMPFQTMAVVKLQPNQDSINLSSQVQVLRQSPADLNIQDILLPKWQSKFLDQPANGQAINLGLTSDVVWIRIELNVLTSTQRDWILDIPYGDLKTIEWFVPSSDARKYMPASELSAPLADYRYHAQPVTLLPGTQILYARVQSYGSLTLPIELQTPAAFAKQENFHLVLQALYLGAVGALLVYALLFGWSVKERTYLIFSAFLFSSAFAIFVGNGLARVYLWPPTTVFEPALQVAGWALAGFFSLWLTKLFVSATGTNAAFVGWLRLFLWGYLLVAICMFIRLWFTFDASFVEAVLSALTLLSSICVIGILLCARAVGASQLYFFGAWTVVWFGALAATMRSLDWIPSNHLTLYALQISTGISAILFSVALFVRVRQHDLERLSAQQEALEARQALIQTLQNSERELEAKVTRRTVQLQDALESEKRLREQYVRFGAMISHEFRNPLGVIETQSSLLKRELNAGIDNTDKRIGSVRAAAQRLALLFEKWLQSDRLQNATDKIHKQALDFDAWLLDLVDRCQAYHANHRVSCRMKGCIGVIQADERLLQIAILNLIDNACKYSAAQTEVHVTASRDSNQLCIEVTDQGVGIAAEHLDQVFDEYFRVDQNSPVLGVGLGLPFVRKIVSLHGGGVSATSNPDGQGTRFSIRIPIDQQSD